MRKKKKKEGFSVSFYLRKMGKEKHPTDSRNLQTLTMRERMKEEGKKEKKRKNMRPSNNTIRKIRAREKNTKNPFLQIQETKISLKNHMQIRRLVIPYYFESFC